MADYDNTNTGVLFPNQEKKDESHADSSGSLFIGSKKHYLDAWRIKPNEQELAFKPVGGGDKGEGQMLKVDKTGKAEKHPDWKGTIKAADGTEYKIAGWVREAGPNSKTPGRPFLSLKIETNESQRPATDVPADDEAPF